MQAKFLFFSETFMHRQAFHLHYLKKLLWIKSLLNPFSYKRSPASLFFYFLIKNEISKAVQYYFYFLKDLVFIDLSPTHIIPNIYPLLR